MSHAADYLGHIDIEPPLNDAEAAYVTTLMHARAAGVTVRGAPRGSSPWLPCPDGCCLTHVGTGRADRPVEWLRFLIDHVLGAASDAAEPVAAEGLTHDHHLDGIVVGSRRADRELFSIVVDDADVVRHTLHAGDHDHRRGPLAREQSVRGAVVVDLQSRRR